MIPPTSHGVRCMSMGLLMEVSTSFSCVACVSTLDAAFQHVKPIDHTHICLPAETIERAIGSSVDILYL